MCVRCYRLATMNRARIAGRRMLGRNLTGEEMQVLGDRLPKGKPVELPDRYIRITTSFILELMKEDCDAKHGRKKSG